MNVSTKASTQEAARLVAQSQRSVEQIGQAEQANFAVQFQSMQAALQKSALSTAQSAVS